jgi:hypothetical protein
MASASDSFLFCHISSKDADEAFRFHLKFSDNKYIWPRTEEQIKTYSENGELFAVRNSSSREIVGICYVTLDGNRWELGGLGISPAHRAFGLGRVLTRFALSRTIAANKPWFYDQTVIAHVHEYNMAPRNVLREAGFEQNGQEIPPQDKVPASMKRNAANQVVGDVFVFPKTAVSQLIKGLEKDFSEPLHDGKTKAVFDENDVWTLEMLRESLEEAI